jgi:hypothetical protein
MNMQMYDRVVMLEVSMPMLNQTIVAVPTIDVTFVQDVSLCENDEARDDGNERPVDGGAQHEQDVKAYECSCSCCRL